jgi:diguanylate cyclase (GGDEF)-like protein/PAS domain S-box-containing protein
MTNSNMTTNQRASPVSGSGYSLIRGISDALPLGVMVTDHLGHCVYANEAYRRITGRSADELLSHHWISTVHAEDRQVVLETGRLVERDCSARISEARLVRGDGSVIWVRRHLVKLDRERPGAGQVHTIEDISDARCAEQERIALEESLLEANERAQVTLESIGDAVISTDVRGNITYMNGVAETMTGWVREDALSRPLAEVFRLVNASTREPAANPAQRAIDEDRTVDLAGNSVLLRRDGEEVRIEDSAAPIHDRAGAVAGAVIVFHDAKFSHEMTTRMAYLARHDALTGLLNRTALSEQLAQALRLARRHGKQVGLLFIDLDNFKEVNDSLGHQCGDQVLITVSEQLVACVRATDTVFRYGGDEFVVLLSELESSKDAALVARKLASAVAAHRLIGARDDALSLSVGISVYPDDGDDPDTLLQQADTAMYRTKSARAKSHAAVRTYPDSRGYTRPGRNAELMAGGGARG